MDSGQDYSWFAETPTEVRLKFDKQLKKYYKSILLKIFDIFENFCQRFELTYLVRVNKRIHGIAQYILENRKKIRLVSEHLAVLVLSPPSDLDYLELDTDASRASLLIHTILNDAPANTLKRWGRVRERAWTKVKTLTENKRLAFIEPPAHEPLRRRLFISAIAADVFLLILDPQEVDKYSEYIKDTIFGSCFMMSARNVIVAIDLHKYQSYTSAALHKMYVEAKTKIAKVLNRTVGMCYTIVPIDVCTGGNIIPKIRHNFTWFNGPSVLELLVADQMRTNFDEIAYKKICEEPFKLQLIVTHDIFRVGVVLEGRVMSGTLQRSDKISIHPGPIESEAQNIESYFRYKKEGKPGDIIAISAANVSRQDIRVLGSKKRYTYIVKSDETTSVNCTMAFRAQIVVVNSNRFVQHQIYHMFYGRAHIKCLLWWIFPTDGKNHDRAERKLKAKGQVRPPRQTFKKATAILVPLIHYDIETYKPSAFEKNYRGKVMIMEKNLIVGVGRVDRVISVTAPTLKIPSKADYEQQYATVVAQASSLFNLPAEQKQLELFVEHVTTNEHAKKSILRLK